jgi:hypothetical protein
VGARSLSCFDPLATELQESRAVFKISLKTREYVETHFSKEAPFSDGGRIRYADAVRTGFLRGDRTNAMLFIEYWWRDYDPESDRYSVHMRRSRATGCLPTAGTSSPWVFRTRLLPVRAHAAVTRKGSCLGLGIVTCLKPSRNTRTSSPERFEKRADGQPQQAAQSPRRAASIRTI